MNLNVRMGKQAPCQVDGCHRKEDGNSYTLLATGQVFAACPVHRLKLTKDIMAGNEKPKIPQEGEK